MSVFAAASLTESFNDIAHAFEARHADVRVVFNFAGSQQLRAQLEQGASADVFASANRKEIDAAVAKGTVNSNAVEIFATNRLVVISPKSDPERIESLADLARPGLKLDLADPSVPVGKYTLQMLDAASKEQSFGVEFKDRVLANVVSREQDVKAVVAKVRLGEADAGIVYQTDASGEAAGELKSIPIPNELNPLAEYPIAPLARSAQPALAREFVEFVLSPDGRNVLKHYGFGVAGAGKP